MKGSLKSSIIIVLLLLILIILAALYFLLKPASLAIIIPNGGENWEAGLTYEIKWRQRGLGQEQIAIWLQGYDSEGNLVPKSYRIVEETPAGQKYYSWEIPLNISAYFQTPPDKYKIRITEAGGPVFYDESNNYFSINFPEQGTYFDLPLRIADCATVGTDCEGDEAIEAYGCALEGATVTLAAENQWNDYYGELIVNSGEHSDVGDAPAGLPEWMIFKNVPVWTDTPDYEADNGFYRITVTKDGYVSKTGLIGIFGTTGADLYWNREFIGNYICLETEKLDLVVTDIEFTPANPKVGDEVSRVAKVLNQGNVASYVVNIRAYVDDVEVAYGSFGPLQPGATIADYSHNVHWGGPWTAIAGTHKFEFVIDADNYAVESDETNNSFIKYLTVVEE